MVSNVAPRGALDSGVLPSVARTAHARASIEQNNLGYAAVFVLLAAYAAFGWLGYAGGLVAAACAAAELVARIGSMG